MVEYSNQELIGYINELQKEIDKEREKKRTNSLIGNMGFSGLSNYQNSIVEWQLDLNKELELIHHQIRGHVIKRTEDNEEYWAEPSDEEQKLLNEKGAQEVEKIIRNYLNKNLLLSNFSEEMINERIYEFSSRLRRFIYLNYEEFGLTTSYKQKHFEMIVMNITDMVEAAYYRSLNGGERESLTTVRQIIQQESFDNKPQAPQINQQRRSRLNPFNWFK